MTTKKEKTVGIIGGMGPDATVDLMQRIIKLTPAIDDADHIHCIIDNNPKIPSRIKAIIEGIGEDPGPCMAAMAQRLEACGADVLAIACNTAHHYFQRIQNAVRIPVIHMIDAVLDQIRKIDPDCRQVGILASPAIRITKIYEQKFTPANIKIIFPDPDFQQTLFRVIKKIKAGNTDESVHKSYQKVCCHLAGKGVDLAIIGCTELSALNAKTDIDTVDAAHALAKRIVTHVKGKTI